MRKFVLLLSFLLGIYSCGSSDSLCSGAKHRAITLVKLELKFPEEADFELMSQQCENTSGLNYSVLGLVTAKNAFGVKTKYVYKYTASYTGGDSYESDGWENEKVKMEIYRDK
ncbi:hypothetical protein ACI76W_04290 [Capnocytophaga canimorsus]|uniref:hypothetical protein n=1 Tax=Capnocytophaga canimorsus TaxID=28188 RepID=UPI00385CEF03